MLLKYVSVLQWAVFLHNAWLNHASTCSRCTCTLEALRNVAKHARASRATVRLSGSGDALEFSVTDDGAGFPATATRAGSACRACRTAWPPTAAP